ncbi:MAG: CoA transferase [Proteobacteria bacterium]|nr:CoA transferase [Pseudomonadota bacterium]
MAAVLQGVRVLDLSWGIAGPMATMLLTDHGAQVTRIEPPGGDPFRGQLGYHVWQRGKRSAILDLKAAADLATFKALVTQADILVESFTPGVTQRLGIDYATLSQLNPRLIYLSITAYGRDNPHSQRPGYDALVAARTGLQWEQRGWPEGAINHMAGVADPFAELEIPWEWLQGPAREGPVFTASAWPSLGACFAATTAVSAALRAREVTGRGQWVETSLLQGAMACASGVWQRAQKIDAPMFNSWILGSRSPKGHFQCADRRWIHNWVPNPRFLLTAAAGDTINSDPDLKAKNDPDRFGTGPEELLVMAHYQPLLADAVRKFPAAQWVDAAATAGMTIQDVRTPEEALTDPLFIDDGCVTELRDRELGPIRQVGITYRLERSPGVVGAPAAPAGEHTQEVRAEAAALGTAPAGGAAPATGAAAGTAAGGTLAAPLAGITVLDLGLAIAGPYGTQILSDLGARVIKINALYDTYWHSNHIAYMANRGKESIALDLKDPRAMKILLQLVERADVVQHNMRYEAAERLRIDYASLKELNPRLVYCHTRGFETGPRESLPGNDQTGACLTGVQYEDGGMSDGGKPLWSLTSLGDTGNGFLSAIAIIQALYQRERTGFGQFCETSIVNAHLLNSSYAVARPDGRGFERPRIDGDQLGFDATHRLYQTREGWLCVVLATQQQWLRFCAAVGLEELPRDPRFADSAARWRNRAALAALIEPKLLERSAAQWFAVLDAAQVPCEISDPQFSRRLHDDPVMKQRGWVASYPHPMVGRIDQVGLLFDFSDTPGRVQGAPLVVGQHSRAILAELGYPPQEIDTLCQDCVLAWSPGEGHRKVRSPWQPQAAAPPAVATTNTQDQA